MVRHHSQTQQDDHNSHNDTMDACSKNWNLSAAPQQQVFTPPKEDRLRTGTHETEAMTTLASFFSTTVASSPCTTVSTTSPQSNSPYRKQARRRRVTSDTQVPNVSFEEEEEEQAEEAFHQQQSQSQSSESQTTLQVPSLVVKERNNKEEHCASTSSGSKKTTAPITPPGHRERGDAIDASSSTITASPEAPIHSTSQQQQQQQQHVWREQQECAYWQSVLDASTRWEQIGEMRKSAQVLDEALFLRNRYGTQQALPPQRNQPCARVVDDPLRRAYLIFRLGLLQWKMGQYAASLSCLKQARDVYEPRQETDDSQVLVEIYAALGQVALSMGAATQAKRYYLQALRTIELDRLFLEEDPHDSQEPQERWRDGGVLYFSNRDSMQLLQAKVLRQLGILLMELGKMDKAGTALSEALRLQQSLLGCWHVEYAHTLLIMGQYHEIIQDYATAACLYLDALDIYRQANEQESLSCQVDVGVTLARIGWLYYLNQDYTEANAVYLEAHDSMVSVLGPNHANMASLNMQIGLLYAAANQWDRALKRYKKTLEIQRQVYGDDHESIAHTLMRIASIYHRQERKHEGRRRRPPEKALLCVDRALHIRQSLLGRWHVVTGETLVQLGCLQYKMGHARPAVENISRALEIYKANKLESSHPLVLKARNVLKSKKKKGKKRQSSTAFRE